ncbi:acyl-CoA thioesterase [Saccharomonospora saliphila]|uniref:acyl-CoA thioesterase n=1 Tax=Saccharomonospora saliphila TaxID=369829 RepID=UPI0003820C1F|nr:acyl-CoA thioesterase II [Saccharomonospora saliphila]
MAELALDDVLAVLDLDAQGPDTFVGVNQSLPAHRVFGGQLLAQSIVAASRTVRDQAPIHSLHAYFLRPGDPAAPIRYAVDRTRDGRSFTARRVEATQHGRTVFQMLASFQEPGPGPRHQDTMPSVPAPETLETWYPFGAGSGPLEMRRVAAEDTDRARSAVWVRPTGPLPDEALPHTALLAYLSDFSILHAAMRAHSLRHDGVRAKTASLDHVMWFHRRARADDWLLYDTESPSACDARALGVGRLFHRDGTLLATVGQEGMVRVLTG